MQEHPPTRADRTALVIGAEGFIGAFIAAALRGRGWRVVAGVRSPSGGDPLRRRCDLAAMHRPADWHAALAGVDVVVNAAGILRGTRSQSFESVHVRGPTALLAACEELGVGAFVQISALGDPADGAFIASKHAFDEALLRTRLRAVVLRPSVVYATEGSYGGTSLLRAMSALPGLLPVPGHGRWLLQPVEAGDLAELVVRACEGGMRGLFEVAGPAPVTLADYLRAWRRWLRVDEARLLRVPAPLVGRATACAERFGRGPLGTTMWRMLRRGNVAAPDAHHRLHDTFGFAPRALEAVLASRPSHVQDRWHARLYLLAPLMRWSVVALWAICAWVGFATPAGEVVRLTDGSPLASSNPVLLARGSAALDAVLALLLAIGWRPRAVVALMALSVVAYTLVMGVALPTLWLDPLGGLAKNLVLLPALGVLWVLLDRR